MSSTLPSVINMVNTAFGVTVLAVPYCFHQCGIILGCLLLVLASYMSKRSCSFLLRSAQISRKRDFESLGFHVEGFVGKFVVEMSLIGYLGGTCIAWFVVIGDVAPAVLSSLLVIEKTWQLRMILIVIIGLCGVLPLCLVKDINSLSSASKVAIGIYTLFVLQLFFSTLPKILSGEWVDVVHFWKPNDMLQCLPIFVISFLCQTVLFVIYEALHEPTVKKMENVAYTAIDILLFLSITVGFCGYVMFCHDGIQGDLLNNYEHGFIPEFIRLGFCVSTVLSFPLLVFPCRVSINSMISSAQLSVDETPPVGEDAYIPHDRFLIITCSLVGGTLILGILFPSVEFVMALVGATMGASLAYILPSYIFLKVAEKDTPRTEAKVLLVLGLVLFCMSTFTVLSMTESSESAVQLSQVPLDQVASQSTASSNNNSSLKRVIRSNEDVESKLRESFGAKNNNIYEKSNVKTNEKPSLKIPIEAFNNNGKAKPVEVNSRKEPVAPQERVLMSDKEGAQSLLPLEKPTLEKEQKLNEDKDSLGNKKEELNQPKEGTAEQKKEAHALRKRSADDNEKETNVDEADIKKEQLSSSITSDTKIQTTTVENIKKNKTKEGTYSAFTDSSERSDSTTTTTRSNVSSDLNKKKNSRTHL